MYKFIVIAITVILIFTLGVCAYADEIDESNLPEDSSEDELPSESNNQTSNNVVQDLTVVGPVTPSNTSGLKSALLTILGNYDPILAEYSYTNSNGYISYVREFQPDYIWIWSCILLCLVIFCLFRLLGGLFNGRR